MPCECSGTVALDSGVDAVMKNLRMSASLSYWLDCSVCHTAGVMDVRGELKFMVFMYFRTPNHLSLRAGFAAGEFSDNSSPL